jgi:hypothetical protein
MSGVECQPGEVKDLNAHYVLLPREGALTSCKEFHHEPDVVVNKRHTLKLHGPLVSVRILLASQNEKGTPLTNALVSGAYLEGDNAILRTKLS